MWKVDGEVVCCSEGLTYTAVVYVQSEMAPDTRTGENRMTLTVEASWASLGGLDRRLGCRR